MSAVAGLFGRAVLGGEVFPEILDQLLAVIGMAVAKESIELVFDGLQACFGGAGHKQ